MSVMWKMGAGHAAKLTSMAVFQAQVLLHDGTKRDNASKLR
jgi:hypothetical protein